MHKKILIHILSLLLTMSLPMSGMISVHAEEPENEETPSEVVELTEEEQPEETAPEIEEEIPEEQNEQIDLYQPESEETITEEEPGEEELVPEEEEEETVIDVTDPEESEPEEEAPEEEPGEPEEEPEEPAEVFSDDEPVFYVAGTVVPYEGTGVLEIESEYITSGTVTYDYDTNTLTLDNAVIVNDPTETVADTPNTRSIYKSGTEDLTIKLIGENSITVTSDEYYVYYIRGIQVNGLLTITSDDGTGSLDMNVQNTGQNGYPEAIAVKAPKVFIENCTLNVTGTYYAFYISKELHFGAGTNVTAVATKYYAINYSSDGAKVTHSPLECDMYGYTNVDDEEGNYLYKPEYVYDYYSGNVCELS